MSKTKENHYTETQEFFPFGESKRDFRTVSKTKIADTVTPVGLYLRFRDKYANTLLLESSDYHSKEESFSFIAIEPILSVKVDDNQFSVSHKGTQISAQKIDKNFYELFDNFTNSIALDCPAELKSFNGLYGYSTFDSVQYFENIKFENKKAPSAIPEMQYSFYRFIIAINHFNDEMTLIENIEEGTSKVGVAYFSEIQNEELSFATENNQQYLDNSWGFNTEKTYQIIETLDNVENGSYPNGNMEFVLNQIDNTIDSLLVASGKVGDLSITLLSQGHYQSEELLDQQIDLLIGKAKLNQIKINLIGFDNDHESPLRRLAIETNGFIGSSKVGFENYNSGGNQNNEKVTEIGALFQNLDFILRGKLTTHRCEILVNIMPDTPQYSTFSSGEMVTFGLNYDGGYYNIQFKIP